MESAKVAAQHTAAMRILLVGWQCTLTTAKAKHRLTMFITQLIWITFLNEPIATQF